MSDSTVSSIDPNRPRVVFRQTNRDRRRRLSWPVKYGLVLSFGAVLGLGASYLLRYFGY